MLNLERVKSQYNRLLEDGNRELLPLEKVIELELAKLELMESYLNGIVAIDGDFTLIKQSGSMLHYSELLEILSPFFGGLNFEDRRAAKDEDESEIVMAFNHAMINIVYKDKTVKVKIDLYWDN